MKSKSAGRLALILIALVVIGYFAYGRMGKLKQARKPAENAQTAVRAIPVVLAEVQVRKLEETVSAKGTLEARNFALVSPRIPGVLEEVAVREGDDVKAGETALLRTDRLKLEKAVEIARQNHKVATCARQEKEAYLEKIEVELRKAKADYDRYKSLLEEKVVTRNAYELMETSYDKARASQGHAASLLQLAREEETKAASAVGIAEKDLKDATVLAPISGKVSRRMAEPGEMGAPGIPALRIDDLTAIEASAYLPGQYYERITKGETRIRLGANGQWWGEYAVSYKSPTVDPTLRTFEIKCDLAGDGARIVPGALVDAVAIFSQREAVAVPSESVQRRAGGLALFIADGQIARMKMIQTGLESDGWIEVTGGEIKAGDRVAVKGQFLLNDGSVITEQKARE
ncbi:MAG TPA: efflux RND transporter periplasmic adaptor subunit [Candidatus Brocadiia bacterium]|nr:efflux RND transporter periplasmic adaptor subunit [Candidatus Brocadiia bacterium]